MAPATPRRSSARIAAKRSAAASHAAASSSSSSSLSSSSTAALMPQLPKAVWDRIFAWLVLPKAAARWDDAEHSSLRNRVLPLDDSTAECRNLLPLRRISRQWRDAVDAFIATQTHFVANVDASGIDWRTMPAHSRYFATLPMKLLVYPRKSFPWKTCLKHFAPKTLSIIRGSRGFVRLTMLALPLMLSPRLSILSLDTVGLVNLDLISVPLERIMIYGSTVTTSGDLPHAVGSLSFTKCWITLTTGALRMPNLRALRCHMSDVEHRNQPGERVWHAPNMEMLSWSFTDMHEEDDTDDDNEGVPVNPFLRFVLGDKIRYLRLMNVHMKCSNRMTVDIPPTAHMDVAVIVHSGTPPWPLMHGATWRSRFFVEYMANSSLHNILWTWQPSQSDLAKAAEAEALRAAATQEAYSAARADPDPRPVKRRRLSYTGTRTRTSQSSNAPTDDDEEDARKRWTAWCNLYFAEALNEQRQQLVSDVHRSWRPETFAGNTQGTSLVLSSQLREPVPWRYVATFRQLEILSLDGFATTHPLPHALFADMGHLRNVILIDMPNSDGLVNRFAQLPNPPAVHVVSTADEVLAMTHASAAHPTATLAKLFKGTRSIMYDVYLALTAGENYMNTLAEDEQLEQADEAVGQILRRFMDHDALTHVNVFGDGEHNFIHSDDDDNGDNGGDSNRDDNDFADDHEDLDDDAIVLDDELGDHGMTAVTDHAAVNLQDANEDALTELAQILPRLHSPTAQYFLEALINLHANMRTIFRGRLNQVRRWPRR